MPKNTRINASPTGILSSELDLIKYLSKNKIQLHCNSNLHFTIVLVNCYLVFHVRMFSNTVQSEHISEEAWKHLPGLQEATWPMAIHKEVCHKKKAKMRCTPNRRWKENGEKVNFITLIKHQNDLQNKVFNQAPRLWKVLIQFGKKLKCDSSIIYKELYPEEYWLMLFKLIQDYVIKMKSSVQIQ